MTESGNRPVVDGDEILEGILRWVGIESPTHDSVAVNRMVDHVEGNSPASARRSSARPGATATAIS